MESDLLSFKEQLEKFDWFYEYSDSPVVWENGNRELHLIKDRANELDKKHKTTLFNQTLNEERKKLF